MTSGRTYAESYEKKEELKLWVGTEPPAEGVAAPNTTVAAIGTDIVNLSTEAKTRLKGMGENRYLENGSGIDIEGNIDNEMLIRKLLIEALTGVKIRIKDLKDLDGKKEEIEAKAGEMEKEHNDARQGWGIIYDNKERYAEEEKTAVSASGIIRTSDGVEFKFTLELSMERASVVENSINVRAGDAVRIDPLVINYGGKAAELTDKKFSFDLDSDGTPDSVSFVKSGSGFLFLDANNDGKANNGGELFGPSTGNGFTELSRHDSDGNAWIDESDPIFSRLLIWTKDDAGKDAFFTLKQKDIGAIYLDSRPTGFSLLNPANRFDGAIASTGIFLKEDLTPGTIQQIDLAV